MSIKIEYTNLRDRLPSQYQRRLGRKLLMTDLDSLHYTYKNNEIVFSAIFDYKHHSIKEIHHGQSAIQAQKKLATILEIPLFIVVTYLDPVEHPTPMYYLIPGNEQAKKFVPENNWFSEYDYSVLQHKLRNVSVKIEEDLSKIYKIYDLPDENSY
jgi:hypothetical protein